MDNNHLLQFAKQHSQNLEYGLLHESDSEYLMCFSPIRQNIIAWKDIASTDKILEIGGSNVLTTRLLCSKAGSVVTVEPDKTYAQVNQYVNSEYTAFAIKNTLQDVFDEKYNIITMIGTTDDVLKYDCKGETAKDKTRWLLEQASKALLENGELWLAFSNFYGMNRIAEGTIDFSQRDLYTKEEMQSLLREFGFDIEVYYPVPDYRFAYEVYSEDYLPHDITTSVPKFDSGRVFMFDEVAALDDACKRGEFDKFANSYFFVCKLKR